MSDAVREWVTLAGMAVATVLFCWLLVVIGRGMFEARSLVRRELGAYFRSPIAYVVLVSFLLLTGSLFSLAVDRLTETGPDGIESPVRFMYGNRIFWLVFLFIPPVLTMRSFAEERASGTLESLMTAPLHGWQIVLSKFAAGYTFYVLLWLPTLLYLPLLLQVQVVSVHFVLTVNSILTLAGIATLILGLVLQIPRLGTTERALSLLAVAAGAVATVLGYTRHLRHDPVHLLDLSAGLDPMPALTLYLGMALAGAMFLALGLFVSSLVRDQLVAALVSLAVGLLFILPGVLQLDVGGGSRADRAVTFFSVPLHFSESFTRGLIDTRNLVLYASATVFWLFLTTLSLESRRWR
jgi:ABC-type transport system involved in multi-copper enzyme maturation permease subunit